jgi:hypothetical protein
MFTAEEMKDAMEFTANYMQSAFIRNDGKGKFSLQPLPAMAQWSMINGITVDDVNNDGNLDVLASTNDYGTEVTVGRYDALNGLVLLGDGNGNFTPASMMQSGIYLPADGKAMIRIMQPKGNYLLLASQNKGAMKSWIPRDQGKNVKLSMTDDIVELTLQNGKKRRQEVYHGDGFLSQSSPMVKWNEKVKSIDVINNKNQKRTLEP